MKNRYQIIKESDLQRKNKDNLLTVEKIQILKDTIKNKNYIRIKVFNDSKKYNVIESNIVITIDNKNIVHNCKEKLKVNKYGYFNELIEITDTENIDIDKITIDIDVLKKQNIDRLYKNIAKIALISLVLFLGITKYFSPIKLENQNYHMVYDFSEGLAQVNDLKGKYGFIDINGKEVITPKYEFAESFSEGLAIVQINDKYGFIDKTGKEVIPIKYDYASSFKEGLCVARIGDKVGFIDKTGKEVIPFKYYSATNFNNGIAVVLLQNGNNVEKYGCIDKKGNIVIPIKYDSLELLNENLISKGVRKHKKTHSYISHGLMSIKEQQILPSVYVSIGNFGNGLAPVCNVDLWGEGVYGFIDTNGKEVIPCMYKEAKPFENGYARVKNELGWGIIDTQGNEIIPFGKYSRLGSFHDGLFRIIETDDNSKDRIGFIDVNDKFVIPIQYEQATNFNDGIAVVKDKGIWKILKKSKNTK